MIPSHQQHVVSEEAQGLQYHRLFPTLRQYKYSRDKFSDRSLLTPEVCIS